jgi:hypothetical protein
MLPQPDSTSPPPAANPASASGMGPLAVGLPGPATSLAAVHEPDHEHPPVQRIPRWLERGELFLRVLLRMYIGLAVSCAPWIPWLWDRNPLFAHYPTLAIYAANGAVRGLVSGLGLLNLWIALRDALRGTGRR